MHALPAVPSATPDPPAGAATNAPAVSATLEAPAAVPATAPGAPLGTSAAGDQFGLSLDEASGVITRTLEDIGRDFLAHVPFLIGGILVLIATAVVSWVVRRVVRRLIARVRIRRSLNELILRLVGVVVWIVGLMLAAMIIFPNVQPADALAALGIGSVAIGLAFKDISENFFAGVLILWRFPFENGYIIECDGRIGTVEDVTVRNTVLRTFDGELLILPNASLYKNAVQVNTDRALRRQRIECGVAYDTDLHEAERVISSAMEQCDKVDDGEPIEVQAIRFGPSSIDFEVFWWAPSRPGEQRDARNAAIQAIKKAIDDAGITIPFPQRTLRFPDALHTVGVGTERGDDATGRSGPP